MTVTIPFFDTKPLRVPRGAVKKYDLKAYDITRNELGVEVSRSVTDLTGAVITFKVKDPTVGPATVISKTSATAGEIDIDADPTTGLAILSLVAADTNSLTIGKRYVYDVWVTLPDGRVDTIVDASPFYVNDYVGP